MSVRVCVRVFAYVCVHVCPRLCPYVCASVCVCMCVRVHAFVHVRACVFDHVCVRLCVHQCVCVLSTCVCVTLSLRESACEHVSRLCEGQQPLQTCAWLPLALFPWWLKRILVTLEFPGLLKQMICWEWPHSNILTLPSWAPVRSGEAIVLIL